MLEKLLLGVQLRSAAEDHTLHPALHWADNQGSPDLRLFFTVVLCHSRGMQEELECTPELRATGKGQVREAHQVSGEEVQGKAQCRHLLWRRPETFRISGQTAQMRFL